MQTLLLRQELLFFFLTEPAASDISALGSTLLRNRVERIVL